MDELKQNVRDRQKALSRRWWFVSFVFPLVCAATAPLSNLFSVLTFFEPWLMFGVPTAKQETNPSWLNGLNAAALGTAVIANITLLLNIGHRIRYTLAQSITIVLWYTSATLYIVALALTHPRPSMLYSQSYYYAVIACIMHLVNATLLLLSLLPTLHWPFFRNTFPAYQPYILLTPPQRTLMFQSLVFTLYLAFGAGMFSAIEGWSYLDGIYWTNYSLLTIGFGSDFLPSSLASKIVIVPYTAVGIFVIGLVVTSIHTLFVERFRERIVWGIEIVQNQRKMWWYAQTGRLHLIGPRWFRWWSRRSTELRHSRIPTLQTPIQWSKEEWEVMKYLKKRVDVRRRYLSLLTTFTLFGVIWFGGALLFWVTERDQLQQDGQYTYPLSLYFTYVSLLTIGYGDVIPRSRAGRPFFVAWSLAAVPAMTMLISDIGDTLAQWVREGPIESVIGRWIIGNVHHLPRDLTRDRVTKSGGDEDEDEDEVRDEKRVRRMRIADIVVQGKASSIMGPPSVRQTDTAQREKSLAEQVRRAMMYLNAVRTIIQDDEDKQYSWNEWERIIRLLELGRDGGCEQGDVSQWTWLGDEGPLLSSSGSEKLWILEKFRQKLDDKMEALLNLA
ncbi:hypothetical protein APHAL10511_007513 [Amanita phalloides]|nr:hypothetical protein APHAL10511_007513 [Amanita phalloides]